MGQKILNAPPTYKQSKWNEEYSEHSNLLQRINKNSCRYIKQTFFINGSRSSCYLSESNQVM